MVPAYDIFRGDLSRLTAHPCFIVAGGKGERMQRPTYGDINKYGYGICGLAEIG